MLPCLGTISSQDNKMPKVHPEDGKEAGVPVTSEHTSVWTVWKKSSMAFQGTDGFSVYDSNGSLAFRVENYSRRSKYLSGELLLMDGVGRAVLFLRPQILSMHDRWNGYKADHDSETGSRSLVFTMRRRSIVQQGDEAEVYMSESSNITEESDKHGCTQSGCVQPGHPARC